MEYIIENEYLKVTVTTWGAQVKSVIRKCDGVEHIWQADKSVCACKEDWKNAWGRPSASTMLPTNRTITAWL